MPVNELTVKVLMSLLLSFPTDKKYSEYTYDTY